VCFLRKKTEVPKSDDDFKNLTAASEPTVLAAEESFQAGRKAAKQIQSVAEFTKHANNVG
jgi:hypothetical protein